MLRLVQSKVGIKSYSCLKKTSYGFMSLVACSCTSQTDKDELPGEAQLHRLERQRYYFVSYSRQAIASLVTPVKMFPNATH